MTDTMTTPASESRRDSLAARRAAIAESGWGETFRVAQPRNLTFWVMVFLFAVGTTMTSRGFSNSAQAYTQAFAQGTAWLTPSPLPVVRTRPRSNTYGRRSHACVAAPSSTRERRPTLAGTSNR